jgi:gluconolactonase
MGSDGMTVDSKGNVYLTGKGVTVFNSKGEKNWRCDRCTLDGNVCFGGKDPKHTFVTASKSVFM